MAAPVFPTKDVVISDRTYRLTQLASGEGRALLFKLTKAVGPGFAHLFSAPQPRVKPSKEGAPVEFEPLTSEEQRASAEAVRMGITTILGDLSEALFNELVMTFAKKSEVQHDDGNWARLDATINSTAFVGAYGDLLTWLSHSIAWNYNDFLAIARNIGSRR